VSKGQSYLVVGVHRDELDRRFARRYRASSADEAERMATEEHPDLVVAAVINEEGQVLL
jgi:hypothetical protein